MTICGTGGWVGPLPGDPDNNLTIRAVPAFGGVDVSWTYPTINAHAVAHALLYRGITADHLFASPLAVVAGNTYYDKIDSGVVYYYWIRVVSVNGTLGDWIGPASSMARPLIEDLIEALTGQIDNGVLALSLKSSIDNIALNYNELLAEIQSRAAGDAALSAALLNVQNGIDQALAFINSETTSRVNGDSALITQVDTQAALNAQTAAALLTEQTARVSGDTALASSISSVSAAANKSRTYRQVAAPTEGMALGDLWFDSDDQNKAYRYSGTGWEPTDDLRIASTAAAVVTETQARIDGDNALASQITTAQSSLNGQIASVQTTLSADIAAVDGEVTNIGALYTAKVQVNGLIGGFGVYNTGASVQAGFDVDTFWIGRTGATNRKPFIVVGNETFIDEAAINKLTFSKLRDEAGTFVVENGKIKASYLETQGIAVKNAQGTIVLQDGVGTFSGPISGSQFTTGAYTGYAWPAVNNYGTYLGPSGLLIGNANNGKYFQVTSDGNIYAPGFNVQNGVMNVTQANVINTLNIAGNAVTTPVSAYTAASITIWFGGHWTTVQSVAIANEGQPVFIFGFSEVTINDAEGTGPTKAESRLLRNGTIVASGVDGFGSSSLIYTDYPGWGEFTYELQLTVNGGVGTGYLATKRSLLALGVKR